MYSCVSISYLYGKLIDNYCQGRECVTKTEAGWLRQDEQKNSQAEEFNKQSKQMWAAGYSEIAPSKKEKVQQASELHHHGGTVQDGAIHYVPLSDLHENQHEATTPFRN